MNNQDNKEIDIFKLLSSIFEYKRLIGATTLLCGVLGVGYSILTPSVYVANASVQVEEKTANILKGLSDVLEQESSAVTEISVMKSRLVLGKVVEDLNLDTVTTPIYNIPFISKGLQKLADNLPDIVVPVFKTDDVELEKLVLEIGSSNDYKLFKEDGSTLILDGVVNRSYKSEALEFKVSILKGSVGQRFLIEKTSTLEAIADLQKRLEISESGKQTGVIDVALRGESQRDIKNIVRSVTESYVEQNVMRNVEVAEKSLEFLKKRLPEVKDKLIESEDSLNQYREEHNNALDIALESQAYVARLAQLDADLNKLIIQEGEISQKFTRKHPTYIALLKQKGVLQAEKARVTEEMNNLPKTQKDVVSLSRDLDVDQQIYVQLSNKIQELDVVKASVIGNARILDAAQVMPKPVAPKKLIVSALATILGFAIGVLIALIKSWLNRGIESATEIDEIGLPTYASIPLSPVQSNWTLDKLLSRRGNRKQLSLLSEVEPTDLSVEALRSLRTSLHFAIAEAKNNILMIAGTMPEVGKSFISTNLANIIAKTGQKVLLIDADLRRSYLHHVLALDMEKNRGVTEVISQKLDFNAAVTKVKNASFDVILKGQTPANPSELLSTQRFEELLKWASSQYDLVIVDTPPVLMVTDAAIVGRYAGTTLLVGRFGKSTVKEVQFSKARFEQSGVAIKGFILNCVERKANNRYEYYHYSYK